MDCLDQHAVQASFNVDVAQGTQRHPTTGVESMQEALGRFGGQRLADHPKHFGRNGFELKAGPVDGLAMLRSIGSAGFDGVRQEAAFGGQRLAGTGDDFAQRHAAAIPGHHVPGIGDINSGLIMAAINSTGLMDRV